MNMSFPPKVTRNIFGKRQIRAGQFFAEQSGTKWHIFRYDSNAKMVTDAYEITGAFIDKAPEFPSMSLCYAYMKANATALI